MTHSIIARFNEYINSFHITNERKIAIAVSGGADSLALTFLSANWIKNFSDCKLIALTVDHSLRKESSDEAKQVGKILAKTGIEHHVLTWRHEGRIGSNIQHKARIARRELLTNWCNMNKIKILLVAHTKNDMAETFFMNIFRGSGIYGLSSIPDKIIVNNIAIMRPVLIFTKDELKNYLIDENINWIEDPSNKNKNFLRTKIRNLFNSKEMKEIFSSEDLFLNRVLTNIRNISRARHCIESITAHTERKIIDINEKNLIINRKKFMKLHSEIALNMLSSCLIKVSQKHEYKPRLHSLERLYNFICSDFTGTKTLWKCKIKITKEIIQIQNEFDPP